MKTVLENCKEILPVLSCGFKSHRCYMTSSIRKFKFDSRLGYVWNLIAGSFRLDNTDSFVDLTLYKGFKHIELSCGVVYDF